MDGSYANQNQGTATFLQVNRTNGTSGYGYNRASYLKLDLTNLSTVPTSALLQLTQNSSVTSDSNAIVIKAYGVTDTSWTETGLTWNNAPGLDRTNVVGTGVLLTSLSVLPQPSALSTFDLTGYIAAHRGEQVTLLLISEAASLAPFIDYNSRNAAANTPQVNLNLGPSPSPACCLLQRPRREYQRARINLGMSIGLLQSSIASKVTKFPRMNSFSHRRHT